MLGGNSLSPIQIAIVATADKAIAVFDKTSKELDNLEAKGASFGSKFGVGIKAGLAVASTALVAFTGKAIKEAMGAEVVMFDLENSVKSLGQSVESVVPKVEAMGNAMVNLGFDDEDATRAFTKMNTALKDSDKALNAMSLVADVARKKHMDLASASTLVAKATTGSARLFTEFGIKLDTSIADPTERLNKAFAELQQRIGGTAEAFGQTAEGQLQSFKQELDNVYQAMGEAFLPILKEIIPYLKNFAKWAKQNADVLTKVLLGALTLITAGWVAMAIANFAATWEIWAFIAAIAALIAGFVYAWNNFEWFRTAMVVVAIGFAELVKGMVLTFIDFVQIVVNGFDKILGASSALASFFGDDASAKQLDSWGDGLRKFNDDLEKTGADVAENINNMQWAIYDLKDTPIELDFQKLKDEFAMGLGEFSLDNVGGVVTDPTSAGQSKTGVDKFIQRIQMYQDELALTKEKIDGNINAMKRVADAASANAEKWLKQARAFEKATKHTNEHEKALKRLSTALGFATDAQRYQNTVNAEAEKQAQQTSQAVNSMIDTYSRANSYMSAQSRVSGYDERNTFVEVPVIIDGQVLFRVSQKQSLLNNRRNATNGLSVSGSVI